MCEPTSIALGVMAVGTVAGSVMGASGQAKAEGAAIDAQRKQQMELIKGMNYQDANLKLEQKDAYDEAMNQLTQTNLTGIRNESMVRTAIGESGLEGGSMDRIQRITEGDTIRERVGITENYNRDYAAIFGNRIANVENTKSQLKGMAPIMKTSPLVHALNVANSAGNAYMSVSAGMSKSKGKAAPISKAKGSD